MRKYPQWLGVNARRENRVETHRAVNGCAGAQEQVLRRTPHAARRNGLTLNHRASANGLTLNRCGVPGVNVIALTLTSSR